MKKSSPGERCGPWVSCLSLSVSLPRIFRRKKKYFSLRCIQINLRVLGQSLALFVVASVVLVNTYTVSKWHPSNCKEDFGYSQISLEDIQSGVAKPPSHTHHACTLNPNRTCPPHSEVYLLILVKSAVGNFRKRRYIRETWGNDARKQGYSLAFLLGFSQNDNIFVNLESKMHGDIIQYQFKDTYKSNTKKMKMALMWIVQFCRQAKYILIVDDDMYVNIQNSVSFMKQIEKYSNLYLYSGYLIDDPRPERDFRSKHYISEAQYPFYCYPPYIAGGSIFLNKHTVEMFVRVMPFIPEIPFDDVYVGFLAQKLRIKPQGNKMIRMSGNLYEPMNENEIQYAIAQHGYENDQMFRVAYYKTQIKHRKLN